MKRPKKLSKINPTSTLSVLSIILLALLNCGWAPYYCFNNHSLETDICYTLEIRSHGLSGLFRRIWNEHLDVSEGLEEAPNIFRDIHLRENATGKTRFFKTLKGIDSGFLHFQEIHRKGLYIYRLTNVVNPKNYYGELWFYGFDGAEKKIYSSDDTNWDFMVSPDERYLAILFERKRNPLGQGVLVLDLQTLKTLAEYPLKKFKVGQLSLVTWHEGRLWMADNTHDSFAKPLWNFFEIDPIHSSAPKIYPVSRLPSMDFDFNPDKKLVAYSDSPAPSVAEGPDITPVDYEDWDWKEFKKSHKYTTLYLYNLTSKKRTTIDKSEKHGFRPRWLDKNRLEYDNPRAKGRLAKPVESLVAEPSPSGRNKF